MALPKSAVLGYLYKGDEVVAMIDIEWKPCMKQLGYIWAKANDAPPNISLDWPKSASPLLTK